MRKTLFVLVLSIAAAPAAVAAPSGPHPAAKPLDALFHALKQAGSPEEAKPIEEQINLVFLESGSPSVDLLMTRATAALSGGDKDTANKLLQAVTNLAPNYAEGWHHRAQLQIAANDDEGAMLSLEHVIALNPRQFTAMTQLAGMLEDYGNKAGALKLYQRALALDPQLEGIDRHEKALERSVEGQGI